MMSPATATRTTRHHFPGDIDRHSQASQRSSTPRRSRALRHPRHRSRAILRRSNAAGFLHLQDAHRSNLPRRRRPPVVQSRIGISATETSRDVAFCSSAILQTDVFVVPDALKDDRFRNNPLVVDDPHIRFYAGVPLINEEGLALGTICVVDQTPRELSDDERDALKALSRLVMAQMEFRRNLILLKDALSDRTKEE